MGLREDAEQVEKEYTAALARRQKEHIEKVFGREAEPLGFGYYRIDDLVFDVSIAMDGQGEIRMATLCSKCKRPMVVERRFGWCSFQHFEISGLLGLAGVLKDPYVQDEMRNGKCWKCMHSENKLS